MAYWQNSQEHYERKSEYVMQYQLHNCFIGCSCMYNLEKSLMSELLGWMPQGHEMYCHDLEVMALNSNSVNLGVHSSSDG